MTKVSVAAVLMAVSMVAGTGCAASEAEADEETTSSSQSAYTYAAYQGTATTKQTTVYEAPQTYTCPYEIIDGRCMEYHHFTGPAGGYYTTYNPCRTGQQLYCNVFGTCTCS